jgi:hypothetical protein
MKPILAALLLLAGPAAATDHALPPPLLRGEWNELADHGYGSWHIATFHGWGEAFDGGSRVFHFEAKKGIRFDIIAASTAYWTADDKERGRQVFYLSHDKRFYRIEPGSKEEESVLQKLEDALPDLKGQGKNDPQLVKELIASIRTRKVVVKVNG